MAEPTSGERVSKASIDFLGRIDISDLEISVSDRYIRADIYTLGVLKSRIDETFKMAREIGRAGKD